MTEWHPLRSLEGKESDLSRLWKELDKSAEKVGRAIAATSPATMPTLEHSSMADYYNVYEPSDDTYLLIDAIKYDLFTEYPSDSGSGENDNELEANAVSEKEKEDKEINSAAVEFYYSRLRSQPVNNGDNTEPGKNRHKEIVQEFVEKEGYCTDRSTKLLSRLRQLKRLEEIQTVMEIGAGSGVPITYLSKRLMAEKPKPLPHSDGRGSNKGFSVIATDLNPLALEFAQKTATENGVIASDSGNGSDSGSSAAIQSIDFVECDLATPLLNDREGTIDVLVFNPPYVPTEDSEVSGNGIEISWAGGKDGRMVVDKALPQIARLLRKPSGVCYMITVDDNLPSELATILKNHHGLKMVPLVRRRARNEYLSVQKISWMASS